ncbi:bifunctional adenosylcobinamide kinase/adenosylcobinamide-phosphate guanylyltransferase [Chloroflexota bacterium]
MNKELVLIMGGVRSGKSSFAQRLAGTANDNVIFLATAQAGDDEMTERISRHKASRPASWRTVEEPLELARVLQSEAASADVVLVDCLTVWLSNLLIRNEDSAEEEALKQVNMIMDSYQRGETSYILVSGEVGLGLVPPYPMGRTFRDIQGRLNQELAQRADKVFMLLAGIPLDLKSLGTSIT